MSVYFTPPTTYIAERVRAVLAADSWLAAFFGPHIAFQAIEEAGVPISEARLAVIPELMDPLREAGGGKITISLPIRIRAYLPAPTPASSEITPPPAPVAAAGSTGPITGVVRYLLTEVNAYGESFAGTSSNELTVSAKAPVLTLPALSASGAGWRVWRTVPGRSQYRFAGTARSGATTWTDTGVTGDELAPVPDLGRVIQSAVEQALYQPDAEPLPDGSRYNADAALICKPLRPALLTRRNLMAYDVQAVYQSRYDPVTNTMEVGGL